MKSVIGESIERDFAARTSYRFKTYHGRIGISCNDYVIFMSYQNSVYCLRACVVSTRHYNLMSTGQVDQNFNLPEVENSVRIKVLVI